MSIQFKKPKEWQNKYNESSRNNILKLRTKLKAQNKGQQKELSRPKSWFFQKKNHKGLLIKRKFLHMTHQRKRDEGEKIKKINNIKN